MRPAPLARPHRSYRHLARGRKLGSPIAAKTGANARAARTAYAVKVNATTLAVIREVQKTGITSLAGIARTLEARC